MKQRTCLIVEDDDNDVFLLTRTFRKRGLEEPVFIARNGQEAISFLQGKGEFKDRNRFPLPTFIITDLKMPIADGFDLLTWLQNHSECSVVPTVVLSSSNQNSDVEKAYALGANAYFLKPNDIGDWEILFRMIFEFWKCAEKPSPRPCP